MLTHSCPISSKRVDEHTARLNAVSTIIFLYLGTLSPLFWWALLVDFFFRASGNCHLSYFARTNRSLLNLLHIKPKLIDRAPKLFAAKIGVLMSILLLVFFYLGMPMFWKLVMGLFLLAAGLEALFAYCVGCQLYSLFPHKR